MVARACRYNLMMSIGYDWIFWTVGAALGVFALWLLYWSLFHDRSRGRRRCPKCWYDLSGTPGSLRCSECGHAVRREKKLFRTRRRWRWVLSTICILVAAAALALQPKLRRDGWLSIVPTTALVVGFPAFEAGKSPNDWRKLAREELLYNRLGVRQWPPRKVTPTLWDWQWHILIGHAIETLAELKLVDITWQNPNRRVLEAALEHGALRRLGYLPDPVVHEKNFPLMVDAPKTWPRGHAIPFHLNLNGEVIQPRIRIQDVSSLTSLQWTAVAPPSALRNVLGRDEIHGTVDVPVELNRISLFFEVRMDNRVTDPRTGAPITLPLRAQILTATIAIVDEFPLKAVDMSVDQLVRDGFRWRLDRSGTHPVIHATLDEACVVELRNIGDMARIEVLHDGEILFQQCEMLEVEFDGSRPSHAVARHVLNDQCVEVAQGALADDGKWILRFTIDPIQTLSWPRKTRNRYSVGEHYWADVIEQPIDWQDARKRAAEN